MLRVSKIFIAAVLCVLGAASLFADTAVTEDKILRALSAMSPRAKSEIRLNSSNAAEFAADLEKVLAEERRISVPGNKRMLFLIDKKNSVDSSYAPGNLVELVKNSHFDLNKGGMYINSDALKALEEMADAAKASGIRLLVSSAYRSYDYQKRLFDYWVSVDGLEEAERESARPGTSQHQLGCAVDFGSISDDFADTQMGKWMYENAASFGWSLSFPKGYEDITGYRWESWHFRYVGREACKLQKKWFSNIQQYMLEFINELNKIG